MRTLRGGLCVAIAIVALSFGAALAVAKPVPVEKGTAKPEQFVGPNGCGCHAQLIEQWRRSMHSKALTDPLYLTKLEEAQKATDGAIGPFCDTCHGPAATMTGEMGNENLSAGVVDGINCSWCHSVTGLMEGKPANTSHLVSPDGIRRAQIKDPDAPHPAQYSAFHETAEFCGGCHNVDHPVNGMHLEATYSEWAESPWAEEGVTCQDCHMSRQAGVVGSFTGQAAGGSLERPGMYAMTFIGANVAQGDAAGATALLESAATMEIEAPEVVTDGSANLTVTITNNGAGHYLPTGLTEVREMWLEVTATDISGESRELGTRRFVTILEDDEGNAPVELWEATKIKSDDRIPPRESVSESYEITLPEGVDRSTVKAELLYRSASDEFASKAGVDNPVTLMASAESVVYVSDEAKKDAERAALDAGDSSDVLNLVVAALGLGVVIGLVLWFIKRGRDRDA